eukprot:CAMPEP_0116034802 /NCGR_PEP_ID=MMETSP0321-20121206/19891_1 /TAXON_ID=163516 /ORGANISM="Leptocylindrus danicus var. danicus, Strain B650" /LENGTH=355 /DNA_ID=CAMNT_0003511317 /DNA_START=242 /DNA_END=1309 /DNA_ORIENTATION=+
MTGSSSYWNREESQRFQSTTTITKTAKIISLSNPDDDANRDLANLPDGAEIIAMGSSMSDFDIDALQKSGANVIFVAHAKAKEPLAELLQNLPNIEWVHVRMAGLDFIHSPEFARSKVICTNAKGQFSSTLAEYTMMACSYFAKDLPRLMQQKSAKVWEKYNVRELRGATMGIIGYGDIGRACAKLAKAYGMKVLALRRNPSLSDGDPYCDVAYGNSNEDVNKIMSESDYILVAAPLTEATRGLVGKEAFDHAKEGSVFINVGRGPIVDEDALIEALKGDNNAKLRGAALDVFTVEPLPEDSELWTLDNVLISPHNMDQTATFLHEATEFFVHENMPRFLRGMPLLNPVDKAAGY